MDAVPGVQGIILEARSAEENWLQLPSTMLVEADIVSDRQVLGVTHIQTGRSTIVYGTGSIAEIVDSGAAVRNDCV